MTAPDRRETGTGRTARNVAPEQAGEYIAGYTAASDYGCTTSVTPTPGRCCGSSSYRSGELDESLRDDVQEAADVCPQQAIMVED